MIKAAEYARYSTDMQTENSLLYQFTKIHEYCDEHNIEIVATFYDEAKSGTNTSRDGFQAMLEAARRKEFDAVVIYDITRGSRDVADWFNFRKEMRMLKVSVISVENNLGDPLNPNDFLTELINIGLGQHQVLSTRQKSLDGVAVKAKQAMFLGGIAPLGYDIVNGKYVINFEEAEIVKTIYHMYASDKSYDEILNELKGKLSKRGRPFGKNSLKSILENERYIGTYTWNKKVYKQLRKWAGGTPNPNKITVEDAIPQIIDDATWCKVQRRLNSNNTNARNTSKREYLLSGLITCASCGCSYSGTTSINNRGYENSYYTCTNKKRTKTCTSPNIPAKIIEEFTLEQLKEFLSGVSVDEIVDYILDEYKKTSPKLSDNKKQLLDVQTKIKNGMDALLSGIEIPELKEQLIKLSERKRELELAINTASSGKIMDRKKLTEFVSGYFGSWDTMDSKELIQNYVINAKILPNGDFVVKVGVANTKRSERGI